MSETFVLKKNIYYIRMLIYETFVPGTDCFSLGMLEKIKIYA